MYNRPAQKHLKKRLVGHEVRQTLVLVLVYFTVLYKHMNTGLNIYILSCFLSFAFLLVPVELAKTEGFSQKAQWPYRGLFPFLQIIILSFPMK